MVSLVSTDRKWIKTYLFSYM